MFDLINEVAVIGTAFLMMAIGTVWYSSMLFGNFLPKENSALQSKESKTKLVLTFVAYFTMLSAIAYVLVVTPLLMMPTLLALLGIYTFALALLASVFVAGHKSLREYLVTSGFFAVFIIGGGFVLEYWPW